MTTKSSGTYPRDTSESATPRRYFFDGESNPNRTWEEIGFAEFPIVTSALKRPPFLSFEFTEKIGVNPSTGEEIFRTWLMVGTKEYGLPILPDLDIFIAVLKLAEKYNYKKRLIKTTANELCSIAGISKGGTQYKRLKAGLFRFTTTSYTADNVFKHPNSGQPIIGEAWRIITEFRLVPSYQDPGIEDGLPPSYIVLGDKFLNRLRNGQLKPIDLGLWRQLPCSLAKPLFHYFDKNLYRKERFEIGLKKLSGRIALTGKYNQAQRIRLFSTHLETLKRENIISRYQFEPAKSKADPCKVVIFPGQRVRRQKSRGEGSVESPSTPAHDLVSYFYKVVLGKEPPPANTTELKKARLLLERSGGEVELAKYVMDYFGRAARETGWKNVKNIGAVFAHDYIELAIEQYGKKQKISTQKEQEDRHQQLINAYEESITKAIDDWIATSPEDFTHRLEKQKKKDQKEHPNWVLNWSEDALHQYSTHVVRSDLRKKLPLPTLEEFTKNYLTGRKLS